MNVMPLLSIAERVHAHRGHSRVISYFCRAKQTVFSWHETLSPGQSDIDEGVLGRRNQHQPDGEGPLHWHRQAPHPCCAVLCCAIGCGLL